MGVMLEGAKIISLSIQIDKGEMKVGGTYGLVTTAGAVLAKQDFNQVYGGMTVTFSPGTLAKIQELMSTVSADLNTILGLNAQ